MKSKNILKVINNFKKVLPQATHPFHLNMMEGNVNEGNHTCGTIHCHGGWYAVAACNLKNEITFEAGAEQIAKDLGFETKNALRIWAHANPHLWGNESGKYMFSAEEAFYHSEKRPDGAMILQDIIDHWQDVYERVKATELEESQIKEPNTVEA